METKIFSNKIAFRLLENQEMTWTRDSLGPAELYVLPTHLFMLFM